MSDARKIAEAVYSHLGRGSIQDTDIIANALKRAKEEALEEAAQLIEGVDGLISVEGAALAIRKLGSE